MKSCKKLFFVFFFLGACACSESDKEPDKISYSCQYTNKFAGQDCKDYLGSNWDDVSVREENCGAGFVEVDAVLVAEACPDQFVLEGETYPALGVCRVEVDGPGEYHLYSYQGDMGAMESACSSMMKGDWETLFGEAGDGPNVHPTLPEAFEALISTDKVVVSSQCATEECLFEMIDKGETFNFTPVGSDPIAGLVFYPGGNVDPRAYAPSAFALAEMGVFVSIVPMENYLVMSGYNRADDVRGEFPDITKWFVGGHSMGGAMGIRYCETETGMTLDGLIVWASVPGEEYDISDSGLSVLSIYGTLDQGNNADSVEKYKHNLPADTTYVAIEGGDHSQFGYYEDDHPPAEISREEQQSQIIEATISFINKNVL